MASGVLKAPCPVIDEIPSQPEPRRTHSIEELHLAIGVPTSAMRMPVLAKTRLCMIRSPALAKLAVFGTATQSSSVCEVEFEATT